MKWNWTVGMIILISITIIGCNNESKRLAHLAEKTVHSQNDVNKSVSRANENFVRLNRDIQNERNTLQKERNELIEQYKRLDQDRRELQRSRRSDLAWAESFQLLATSIAAITPLFLCAYLIWAASQRSVHQNELTSILISDLASSTPRLIAASKLPAIEHKTEPNLSKQNQQTKEN